jgi:plastocyanin
MRKLLVLLPAVVVLAAAGAATGAASKTVTISHTGYQPTAVSITTGDAVVFANSDTVSHTVDFKSTTGMHCSAAVPLAIAAGQSASCTFSSAGTFRFSDPASKSKNFRGTVTVANPLVAGLTVTPKAVVYGGKSTLAGKLASGLAGESVQVLGQACGETKSTLLATVTTTSGGALSYEAQPSMQTVYTLKDKSLTSSTTVGVKPLLRLSRAGRHHYRLSVSAARSFTGKVATFQRYRPALKRWVRVKRVQLTTSVAGTAPTIVTSAKFRSGIKAHLRVRAGLGPKQVGSCYLAGRSNTIRSR